MEQVSKTFDYYCKNCSAPLMHTQPQYSKSTNPEDYQCNLVERTKLWDEIESIVKHYLQSSGIGDQFRIDDLTQRVMFQSKPFVANNTEHELVQYAIQTAQALVLEHYSVMCAHNTTPGEQPTAMQVQDLEVWPSPPRHYLQSLNSIFSSVRMAIVKRR